MLRPIVGKYVKATYILKALRNINKLKLGDSVKFEGTWFIAIQGVKNPVWTIFANGITMEVHRSQLEMKPLYKRFRESFMHTYNFMMNNWYDIHVRNVSAGQVFSIL